MTPEHLFAVCVHEAVACVGGLQETFRFQVCKRVGASALGTVRSPADASSRRLFVRQVVFPNAPDPTLPFALPDSTRTRRIAIPRTWLWQLPTGVISRTATPLGSEAITAEVH